MLSTKARLLLAICLIALPRAVTGQDFEVAPVLVSFDANPGENQTRTITVRNHSNERQKFTLGLADYTVDQEGTKQAQPAGSTDRSLIDWLTINPAFLELNPNEEGSATLILNVPRTGFNTRWGMVRIEVAKEKEPSMADKQLATGILIVPRIVVLVKQSPRSNQNFSGSVKELREVEGHHPEHRSFQATLVNSGDKILDAKVFLALANLETALEEQFKPTPVTIYPGQERKVTLTLPVEPEPGQYALALLMDYGKGSSIEGAQILLAVE